MKKIITLLLLFVTSLTMAQTYEIQGLKINTTSYILGGGVTPNRVIEGDFGATNTVGIILRVTAYPSGGNTTVSKITIFTNTVDSQGSPTNNTVEVLNPGPLVLGQSYVYNLPGNYNITTADKRQHFFFVNSVVDFTTGTTTQQVAKDETFKIRATETPLPVTLTRFNAVRSNGGNTLAWGTAQELNNSFFEVQTSATGAAFTVLARVQGAGNSTTPRNYYYRDNRTQNGTVYYRLRQVDVNGTATYSPVVAVSMTAMRVYTVGDYAFTIPETATPDALTIVDMCGRVLSKQRPDAALALPAEGTMFVMVLTTKEGKRYTKKVY